MEDLNKTLLSTYRANNDDNIQENIEESADDEEIENDQALEIFKIMAAKPYVPKQTTYEPTGVLINLADDDFYKLSFKNKISFITFRSPQKLNDKQLKYMISCLVKADTLVYLQYYYDNFKNTIVMPNNNIHGGYNMISKACTNPDIDLDVEEFKIYWASSHKLKTNDERKENSKIITTNYSYILFNDVLREKFARYEFSENSISRFGIVDILDEYGFDKFISNNVIGRVLHGGKTKLKLTYSGDVDFSKSTTIKSDSKIVVVPDYELPRNIIKFIDYITVDECIPFVELFILN